MVGPRLYACLKANSKNGFNGESVPAKSRASVKSSQSPKIAILTGPTASGKTGLALHFASFHPEIEIINADSLLIYQGMDLGTAKPAQEERSRVKHHLVDLKIPNEPFT